MAENNAMVMIPVNRIRRGDRLFRPLSEDDMIGLIGSIKENGILQELLVEKNQDDGYTLLAGFNRLDAAKRLNLCEVPCRVVPTNNRVAAIFDTDLFRRDLYREEREKMKKMMEDARKEHIDKAVQCLIPEFQSIVGYLNTTTLQYILNIPREEQERIFRALPEKIIEDTEKIEKLEKQLADSENRMEELRAYKVKSEKEMKVYEEFKKDFELLQQTKQRELEKLVEEKKKEIEEQYKGADENIRAAYERARGEVEKKLKKEIDESKALAQKMSKEVDKKNNEIIHLNNEISAFDKAKKDNNIEKNKLNNKIKLFDRIVATVASPKTVSDRCRIIANDANMIRETLTRLTQDVFLVEKEVRANILKYVNETRFVLDEIEKFMNTIKPFKADKEVE